MYPPSGNANSAQSLLSQLIADPSGDLMRTLRGSLDEAMEKASNDSRRDPVKLQVAEALQPVFVTAREILDKASVAVDKIRGHR